MAQMRSLLSLISGTIILLNAASAVGLISYGLSIFTLSNKPMVASPFLVMAEIVLSLVLQVFCALLGTVFWKIRVDDQRPDLLLSIHRSVVAVTCVHMLHFGVSGWFSPFVFNKLLHTVAFIPLVVMSALFLYKFFSLDVLSDRAVMVRSVLLLDVLALYHVLSDAFVKFNVRMDMIETGSPYLMLKASDDHNLSLFSSVAILFILVKIFSVWLTLDQGTNDKMIEDEKEKESETNKDDADTKESDSDKDEAKYNDVLNRSKMSSLQYWNMVAALVSLTGPPSCLLLFLTAGVFMGASIKPKVFDGKADIFYRLAAGQKREEMDY